MRHKRLAFAADSTFSVHETDGTYRSMYSYRLNAAAAELTELTRVLASDNFRQLVDNEWSELTEEEYSALEKQYMNLQNPMKFKFIPIEQ